MPPGPPGQPVPGFSAWETALRMAVRRVDPEDKIALGQRMKQLGDWLETVGREEQQREQQSGGR